MQGARRYVSSIGIAAGFLACGGSSFGVTGGDGGAPGDDTVGEGGAGDGGTSSSGGGSGSGSSSGSSSGGAACSGTTTTTAGVLCSYAYDANNASVNGGTTSKVQWACSGGERTVTGNGIPDHTVGTFPNANCPNTISTQTISATMTLTPASTGTASGIGIVGYARNGVKLDPSTAGTCSNSGATTTCSLIGNTGNWNIEALG